MSNTIQPGIGPRAFFEDHPVDVTPSKTCSSELSRYIWFCEHIKARGAVYASCSSQYLVQQLNRTQPSFFPGELELLLVALSLRSGCYVKHHLAIYSPPDALREFHHICLLIQHG